MAPNITGEPTQCHAPSHVRLLNIHILAQYRRVGQAHRAVCSLVNSRYRETSADDSVERITNDQLAVEYLAMLHVLGVQQGAIGEERGRDDHRVIDAQTVAG